MNASLFKVYCILQYGGLLVSAQTNDCQDDKALPYASAMLILDAIPNSFPDDHVHILMGTYHGAPWLPAQLDSFVAQTHSNWSLWVSDDSDDTETRAILHAFSRQYPGRVLRLKEGPRAGSAANFLHLLCDPDLPSGFVALSDQDDVWHKRKLEWALARLREVGTDPCVWAARYRFTNAALASGRASAQWRRGPSLGNALVQNILSGHTLTINPAALALVRRAGLQNVPHHEWWVYLLLAATGAKIICDDRIVLDYRQHDQNFMGGRHALGARFARAKAVLDGQLGKWISANLRALDQADVTLHPAATAFLRNWQAAGPRARLQLMRAFGLHRQARLETWALHLAAALGRL